MGAIGIKFEEIAK